MIYLFYFYILGVVFYGLIYFLFEYLIRTVPGASVRAEAESPEVYQKLMNMSLFDKFTRVICWPIFLIIDTKIKVKVDINKNS